MGDKGVDRLAIGGGQKGEGLIGWSWMGTREVELGEDNPWMRADDTMDEERDRNQTGVCIDLCMSVLWGWGGDMPCPLLSCVEPSQTWILIKGFEKPALCQR